MTTVTEQKKCAEVIAEELASRESHLSWLYRVADGEIEAEGVISSDEAQEEVYEMAYGIETYSVARVIWSGGGPADWIEITYNRDDIINVEYIYQDWYDGARIDVDEDSAVYRYAQNVIEGLAS
jgi:hypothetical protein